MIKVTKIVLFVSFSTSLLLVHAVRPHIILIMADDLGWNDVSFHGSSQIMTPNIDALAYSGLILNNYYVTPLCTPSRSALMTGKYPIHTGMQHSVLKPIEPRGLPLTEKILPQYLKELGYSTHIVGKWHLGHFKKEYTPIYRGFDSHLGYWSGMHDYYDHTVPSNYTWGLDMRRNMEVDRDLHGKYSTDIFVEEAENIIKNHNKSNPLFLFLSHVAVHSSNPYNPLPAPDEIVAQFSHIDNYYRRKFAGMLTKLDESVGRVVKALHSLDMLKDCIIVFSTDNGGAPDGFDLNAASNWPLRGVKGTVWEGGVRGVGVVWSPLINVTQKVLTQKMHISDWLPTIYDLAGGDVNKLENIDGYNLWPMLSQDTISPRTEILYNIDEILGVSALMLDEWKIVNGTSYEGWDSWYGPSGRNHTYDIEEVLTSEAGKILLEISALNETLISSIREKAEVQCGVNHYHLKNACNPTKNPCLFNIAEDPCEKNNLAQEYPEILKRLQTRLNELQTTSIPSSNLPEDPCGFPNLWNYTITNFGDFI